ncbi:MULTISPECIES: cytochrome c-type biogenesis protein [Leptolyngbya]|nr:MULTISPECIES: hypothetical protein [Leptolyngbya]MBD2367419.1 hypothetical protein [Leptolyngbya sp. FACHB-161]MBD2373943.1 hypothetical protein [Leptolyngbya sp. FACHB-238]MBD2398257.1 hypothetical protein [Leptolyngbya sp. FACHB-239]MBD2404246.1 hypothetical protein [Leptolyngbya sp. FACHB-402]ULP29076.1 hypothetical protein MCP04_24125 [Leptolyngbya boryana IU 594]
MSMEPMTFTAAAIATLVFSETFKEVGKTLGKGTLDAGGKLAKLLWEKRPGAAKALAAGEEAPEYKDAIVEVETLAQQDTEIAAAIRAVIEVMQAQPQSQQIVNSFVQKAANVVHGTQIIAKQENIF